MSLDVNISEPDEFNCVELHSCIEEIANIKNIEDFTYHVDYICGKGENYIANVFRISIKETKTENVIRVIVKTLINTTRQELFGELHKREVDAYESIINNFFDLQTHLEDKIILPKHVLSSSSEGKEVIILEDLLLDGFEIDEKLKCENLDYFQVQLILEKLAKFHALTFVLESKDNLEAVESRRQKFYDVMFKDSFLSKSKLNSYYTESFDMSLNLIDDAEARKKVEFIKIKLSEILKFYTKPRKYNVFCHGDLWINNILFRNQENNKEVCFLDFQAMRYASPATDILHFLYTCTDSEFRSKHYESLKTEYFKSFELFLKLFNLNSAEIWPNEEFNKEMKEMTPFGLVIALIELRIVTTLPEHEVILKKLTKLDLSTDLEPLSLYRSRVNDVVNEFTRNGMLDKLTEIIKDF